MATPDAYRDRWISCTNSHIVVRGYYFPLGSAKRIPYGAIRDVMKVEMGALTGKGRLWGTASLKYWAHLDLRRPRKNVALVLDVGARVRPFLTPDDPDEVLRIIEQRRSSAQPS